MAGFDIPVAPTQDPNYFRYSEAVKQPEANQAGLYAGKAVAEGIDAFGTAAKGGIELADSTIKDSIKTDETSRINNERDSFSQALTNTRDTGNPAGVTPDSNAPDLMAQNAPVPAAIRNGLADAARTQAGMEGNKISETTYYKNLDNIATSLRSRYGQGYGDYIDEQMSKITGVTPANAYIKSIIQDLNRSGSKQQSETEKWEAFIRSNHDYPGADKMYESYQQNGDSNKVMQWANYNGGIKSMLALKKAAMEVDTADKASGIAKATDYAQSLVSNIATNGFYNMRFLKDEKTGAQIIDTISRAARDPNSVDDESIQRLGQLYESKRNEATTQAMQTLFTKDPKTGLSVADRIGADAAKKLVDTNIAALYDSTSKYLQDRQFGPAYSNLNRSVAVVNDAKMKILGDPSIGRQIALTGAINNIAPNVAPLLIAGALQKNMDTDVNHFVDSQAHKALAQPDLAKTGQPYTFSQAIDELKTAGITDGNAFKSLTNLHSAITQNDSPKLKETALTFFFNPKNQDVMSKFKDDYYDPNTHQIVKGASAVYSSLTSPDVTQAVKKYADAGHPEAWRNYTNWAKSSFSYQLINNVNDLKDAEDSQFFHISWNTDKHEIGIVNKDGSPLSGLQATALNLPYRAITNLNEGLRHLQEMAKADGSNVDAFLLQTLKQASPRGETQDVVTRMMSAIKQAHTPPVKVPSSQ